MHKINQWMGLALAGISLCGCTHLKGVVVDEASGRPIRSAVLTVGRPNGIAVFERHRVNENGQFDFSISPTDETDVYVYDASGDAEAAEHLDPTELSEKMRIKLAPAPKRQPSMLEGIQGDLSR